MQSRSASSPWHSHLQKGKANVVEGSATATIRTYRAYAGYLRRAVDKLEAGRNASNDELNAVIDQFIAAHTGPADSCPARLMEAKHQLNDLHKMITDLAALEKSIMDQIEQKTQQRDRANDEIKKLKEKLDDDKSNNADEKEEARNFLDQLKREMAILRKIAQPDVTMNISARTVSTSGGAIALLQVPTPDSPEVKETQDLVKKTEAASSSC
jgi:chromosome segregation ATPase